MNEYTFCLNTTICFIEDPHLGYIYLIVLTAILLIVIGLVLVLKVVRAVRRRRKKKNRFIKHTSIRGSTRSSSFGGSYNVRTQDQLTQLPVSQSKFEYVDMLAQTPTTLHAWSEDNLATGFDHRSLDRQEHNISTDPLFEGGSYDEQGTAQEGERARAMSQFTRTTEQHPSTRMQRGSTARASTRSMPGMAVITTTESGARKRTRAQTGDFQQYVQQSRHQVRSMFDPLPDVPTESQQDNLSVDESVEPEPEIIVNVLSPDSPEPRVLIDQDTTPSHVEKRVSCSHSERNFQFEDGFLLHADVPPFLDPDITMANGTGSTQEITIYSSQILKTVEGAEGEQAVPADDQGEVVSSSVVEDNTEAEDQLYNRLDHTLSPHTAIHFAIQEPERSQPEGSALYSQLVTESPNSSLSSTPGTQPLEEENEVLYDRPVIVRKLSSGGEKNVNIKDLFDDPGYTQGMMGGGLTSSAPQQHQNETEECNWENSEASSEEANDNVGVSGPDLVEPITTPVVQFHSRVNMESVPLLDYQAGELSDLDPDIASCFMSTEDLSQRISYV